jgi:hypothetical protein
MRKRQTVRRPVTPTPDATLVSINELVMEAWANLMALADNLCCITNALERAGIKALPLRPRLFEGLDDASGVPSGTKGDEQ